MGFPGCSKKVGRDCLAALGPEPGLLSFYRLRMRASFFVAQKKSEGSERSARTGRCRLTSIRRKTPRTGSAMEYRWPKRMAAIVVEDDREHDGEQRFFAIGQLRSGKIVALSYTYRDDEMRPISLRNATPKERRRWHEG
ncbi:MAG TPA: BrnT family toxin [Beijerinckiaceae bacterium]|nr:BrnT family toxin [Beijerinckiaceae bacterium]